MSPVLRPQRGENENDRRPASRENQDKSRYEGFEGMNFEQRRQPFEGHPASNSDKNKPSPEEGKPHKKD